MNNYSDPMITYDEIVEALKAIVSCTKVNGYSEEYGFLNIKYDSLKQSPIQKEQEQALVQALQSLEKTIENANKVIREALEQEIERINSANSTKINALYVHDNVRRKLAAQTDLVMKLKRASLPIEVLKEVEEIKDLPDGLEEIEDDVCCNNKFNDAVSDTDDNLKRIDVNKIQILRTALDKARKNGNDSLATILEQQLLQAIDNIEL